MEGRHAEFGLHWDIRFIIHGHNANFERPISQFVAAHDVAQGAVKIFLATSLKGGGPKQSDSTEAKGSGLKRKLPPPSPMPNIHERPPTPPSVPGTPPQPPTPPLPPRLLPDGQQHGGSGSEYTVSSESSDGEPPAPPESFHQVIDLARGDFDRALAVALDFWMRAPNIDWDGDINGVAYWLREISFTGLEPSLP